jgi:RNA polymerase sigma factor (sigma-70 family)
MKPRRPKNTKTKEEAKMGRFFKVGEHGYIMENWQIKQIIYTDIKGKRERIEVTEEMRPIIQKAKDHDAYRIKREAEQRGETCTNRSDCTQCGECGKTYKKIKKFSTGNPCHTRIERRERREEIETAINQLPPKQQRLIRQRYFKDIPATEIARSENVSKSAISHMEDRALKKLKELLTQ